MIANKDGGVLPGTSEWLTTRSSQHHRRFLPTMRWKAPSSEPATGCSPVNMTRVTGSASSRGIRSSSPSMSCSWPFWAEKPTRLCVRCARYIRDHQKSDGGWAIYPGGPTDISASVKAYFALKLVGTSPDDPAMLRARRAILDAGGAHQCNSFTRFYLALLARSVTTSARAFRLSWC